MASSFLFLFLFHALHKQNLQHHNEQHPLAKKASTPMIQHATKLPTTSSLPPLTAFLEESSFDWLQTRPLARRKNKALKKYVYPQVQTCRDIPNQWPVDHPIEWDESSSSRLGFGSNMGRMQPLYPHRYDYAERFCPVDADPFLPWIHDVFVNNNHRQASTNVEFIAHNKRRCRSAPMFRETDLKNLEPQVALLQSVSIKRLNATEQKQLLSLEEQEWLVSNTHSHRYRLASLDEADEDGRETRFICQFHSLVPVTTNATGASTITTDEEMILVTDKTSSWSSWKKHILGETLSAYPFNYEHDNFRKGRRSHPLLTRPKDNQDVHGAHNEQVWNSILLFSCPIPSELQSRFRASPPSSTTGNSNSPIPPLYLDLVPIRTPPRENREGYCPQLKSISNFDPDQEWGTQHVLPPVEQSGRWANIQLCPISSVDEANAESAAVVKAIERPVEKPSSAVSAAKPHYLVGCLWASAVFKTRGMGTVLDTSTSLRLLEWLTFHLEIAKFDHIYIYDNTQAFTNETSLEAVTRLFPPDRVTRIPWRFRVCNNNPPAHRNSGERSSQYAAEASCRVRFGPDTEWMSFFDTDEYLIPQKNWTDIQTWLKSGVASGAIAPKTNILSFYQTRALPNIEFMQPYIETDPSSMCTPNPKGEAMCLAKSASSTFLETYDCEPTPLPKPDYGFRAKKQLFRPSFLLNHFVHYTTVTRRIHEAPEQASPPFDQRLPYERRVDELTEAFMLHTKTTDPAATANWTERCRNIDEMKHCPVGIAWPLREEAGSQSKVNSDGFGYNCYQHARIQKDLGLKVRRLVLPLMKQYEDWVNTNTV